MPDKPFPRNPYVIGVPLTGDAGFYGRRATFEFIDDILAAEQQNVVVFYGQRRVGKTSLLHQIVRKLKDKDDVAPVYFDLQGKEQNSLGEVLDILAQTVARSLKLESLKRAPSDDSERFFREKFLPAVYDKLGQRRLLLLFDEFDVLSDELNSAKAAATMLFPYLQDLIMHQRQIVFIFVVGRRIEELATHFQSIFKQAAYRRIGLLKPENTRELITEPVKELLTFEDKAVDAILKLTSGHPYFTQLICSETFNDMRAKDQRLVTADDIFSLVDRAIESGHGALNWFWEGLPRAERFIMSAVAHVSDERGLATQENIRQILEQHKIVLTGLELQDAPDRLVEWEMLRREDAGSYRFVVDLVRRWILKTHSLKSARRDVDLISKRASRLYENAREAHSEGVDLPYARDEYRRALDANPNHSGAQLGLAQVLLELGEVTAAIEAFEKAYENDEFSARDGLVLARHKQGKILEEAGQENEAIFQYELAYKIAPANETIRRSLAAIWRKHGDAALAEGDLTASFELYQKALALDRSEATTQSIRLNLNQSVKFDDMQGDQDYEYAINRIEQLRDLALIGQDEADHQLAQIWLARGHRRLAEVQIIDATKAYQQALTYHSSDTVEPILHYLTAYIEQTEARQNYNEATLALEQLRTLLPENETAVRLEIAFWTRHGDALAQDQQTGAEAIKAYQRALELSPRDLALTRKLEAISANWEKLLETDRLYNQALIAHKNKDWATAESIWLQLLKMDVLDYKGRNIAALLAKAHESAQILQRKISLSALADDKTDITERRRKILLELELRPSEQSELLSTKTLLLTYWIARRCQTTHSSKTQPSMITTEPANIVGVWDVAGVTTGSNLLSGKTIPPPEKILEVLKRFKGKSNKFYLDPEIPTSELEYHRQICPIPKSEHILGLISTTTWLSAKPGLLFGFNGIYYDGNWSFKQTGSGVIPYYEFPNRTFTDMRSFIISVGIDQIIDTSGSGFRDPSAEVIEILNALKDLIIDWNK